LKEDITMETHTEMQKKTPEEFTSERAFAPPIDVYEGADETWLVADLPGVKREDLAIEIESGELRFHAKGKPFLEGEPPFHWVRAFRIPPGIDGQKVTADLRDGVLVLKLPKPSELKPRKIEVRGT
jgi:HSP20 family molecular chaperone IbpA